VEKLKALFKFDANETFIMPTLDPNAIEEIPWDKLYAFIKLYRDSQFPISIDPAQLSALRACVNYHADDLQQTWNSPILPNIDGNLYEPICKAIRVWRAQHFFGSNHLFQLSSYTVNDRNMEIV